MGCLTTGLFLNHALLSVHISRRNHTDQLARLGDAKAQRVGLINIALLGAVTP
jgi:hypothetical protein